MSQVQILNTFSCKQCITKYIGYNVKLISCIMLLFSQLGPQATGWFVWYQKVTYLHHFILDTRPNHALKVTNVILQITGTNMTATGGRPVAGVR